jgi:hypothetical protein
MLLSLLSLFLPKIAIIAIVLVRLIALFFAIIGLFVGEFRQEEKP